MSASMGLTTGANTEDEPPCKRLKTSDSSRRSGAVIWKTWTQEDDAKHGNQNGTSSPLTHHQESATQISALQPEVMSIIFSHLDVASCARAAQVCTAWRDAAYVKSVWRGVQAQVHLTRQGNTNSAGSPVLPSVLRSLTRRGIKRVQVLSIEKGSSRAVLQDLIQLVPRLEQLNLTGCYTLTNKDIALLVRNIITQTQQSSPPRSHLSVPPLLPPGTGAHLKHINLSMCKLLSDDSVIKLVSCPSLGRGLEVLNLSGCTGLTSLSLEAIARHCGSLKDLNLRSTQVTDSGIVALCGGEEVILESSLDHNRSRLSEIARPTPTSSGGRHVSLTLERLSVQDCQKISDEGFRALATSLPHLTSLNASLCQLTDGGLRALSAMSHSLEELILRSCDSITDAGLASLCETRMPRLASLDLSFCSKINDQGVQSVTQSMTQLVALSLNSNQNITDDAVLKISKGLVQLEELALGQCTKLTDGALEAISKHSKSLKKIDLYGCSKISAAAVQKLLESSPHPITTNMDLRQQQDGSTPDEDAHSKQQSEPSDDQEVVVLHHVQQPFNQVPPHPAAVPVQQPPHHPLTTQFVQLHNQITSATVANQQFWNWSLDQAKRNQFEAYMKAALGQQQQQQQWMRQAYYAAAGGGPQLDMSAFYPLLPPLPPAFQPPLPALPPVPSLPPVMLPGGGHGAAMQYQNFQSILTASFNGTMSTTARRY